MAAIFLRCTGQHVGRKIVFAVVPAFDFSMKFTNFVY